MASVFDVANYILEKRAPMSAWKLQKLCYYAQAWTLAWEDRPLFNEDFQAWRNGPVCPELFYKHQGKYMIGKGEISGDASKLSTDDKENIDLVLDGYGDKDAYWLREQTHAEAPWKNARGNLDEFENSQNVITKEAMGSYYGSL